MAYMQFGFIFWVMVCVSVAGGRSHAIDPLDLWQSVQPPSILKVVAFKNQFFGMGSALWASGDGAEWTRLRFGSYPGAELSADDSVLVYSHGNEIYSSRDGYHWDTIETASWLGFEELLPFRGNLVGVLQRIQPGQYSPALAWSADGLSWNPILTNLASAAVFRAGDSLIASVLADGDAGGLSLSLGFSTDGTNWNFTALGASMPYLFGAAFGNGTYVGLGSVPLSPGSYRDEIVTLTPAGDLQVRRSVAGEGYSDVIFDGSRFIVVGGRGIYSSDDGISWTVTSNAALGSIAQTGQRYLAVAGGRKYVSSDGLDWKRVAETVGSCLSICFGNGRFVAFSKTDHGPVALVSTNKSDWSYVDLPGTSTASAALYGDGLFAGFTDSGTVLLSPDGFAWTQATNGLPGVPKKVVSAGDRYWSVTQEGLDGRIFQGATLTNWSLRGVFSNSVTPSVAVAPGAVVVLGAGGSSDRVVHVSTNQGQAWFDVAVKTPLRDITFAEGRFVAAGDYSYVAVSEDGVNWRDQYLTNTFFTEVQYANGVFLATGSLGVIDAYPHPLWSSTDGRTWIPHILRASGAISVMAFGDDCWMMNSSLGELFRSAPVIAFFDPQATRAEGGIVRLSVQNAARTLFGIESSSDLRVWTPLTNAASAVFSFEQPTKGGQLFLRIRQ